MVGKGANLGLNGNKRGGNNWHVKGSHNEPVSTKFTKQDPGMIQRNSNVGTSSIDEHASNVAGAHYSNFSPNIGIGNGGNSRANARKANGSAVSGSAALLQPPALTFGGSRTTESNGGKSQYLGSAKLPKFGGSSVSHAG